MTWSTKHRKRLTVALAMIPLAIMTVLVSESVTLYRIFCGATGFGGTTQRVAALDATPAAQTVTVRFDANVAPGLPWRFTPVQNQVTVNLGEEKLIYFEAENTTDNPIVGHAAFNVTPQIAGLYFKKIQCFCFTDERLDPHKSIRMPVVFFVDPALESTPDGRDVHTITLSYTFFRTPDSKAAENLSRFVGTTAPNPAHGEAIFGQVCAACHGIARNKEGPMLTGVVGRKAGSVPGYRYSPALAAAGFVWTADRLDRWLAYPQGYVPGAFMPVKLVSPIDRRDIIAYLERESGHQAASTPGTAAADRGATANGMPAKTGAPPAPAPKG